MTIMYCPGCGAQQSKDQVYCIHDGTLLVKSDNAHDIETTVSKHCRDCGSGLHGASHYCMACGTMTSHVKLKKQQKNRSKAAVTSILQGNNKPYKELLVPVRREDLLSGALSGLKIAAVPFLLFWVIAWYLTGIFRDSELAFEMYDEIGRSAVNGLIGTGDLFLIIQGMSMSLKIALSGDVQGVSISVGMLPAFFFLFLVVMLSVWLYTRFDSSMKDVHILLVSGFSGLMHIVLLTVTGLFIGGEMNVTDSFGEMAAVAQSYRPSSLTLIQGVLISLLTGGFLLLLTYKQKLLELADGWFRYGGAVIVGLITGFIAYLVSMLFNSIRVIASLIPRGGGGYMEEELPTLMLTGFMYMQFSPMSMLQTMKLKMSSPELAGFGAFTSAEFRSWIFETNMALDLFIQEIANEFPTRQWVILPEVWTLFVPLLVLIAGGVVIRRHMDTVDWKPLLAASLATGVITWLIGMLNRIIIDADQQSMNLGESLSGEIRFGIDFIGSFFAVSLISFVLYYAVSRYKH